MNRGGDHDQIINLSGRLSYLPTFFGWIFRRSFLSKFRSQNSTEFSAKFTRLSNGESKMLASQNTSYRIDLRIIFSGVLHGFSHDFRGDFRTDFRTDFRRTFSCFGARRPPFLSRPGGVWWWAAAPPSLPPPKFPRKFEMW